MTTDAFQPLAFKYHRRRWFWKLLFLWEQVPIFRGRVLRRCANPQARCAMITLDIATKWQATPPKTNRCQTACAKGRRFHK